MNEEIKNIIRELAEKIVTVKEISFSEEMGNRWFSLAVENPYLFTHHEGEGLHALNHIIHRILEARMSRKGEDKTELGVVIDIGGYQKKRVDNIRAIAHLMSERARYFKSNIEVEPMSPFERRIVHEFLANATDLKTESVGTGRSRRVVIKYIGNI